MKTAAAGVTMILLFTACALGTPVRMGSEEPQRVQVAPPNIDLNAVLLQIQQAASSANLNIGKLRIEKWKTDSEQKKQMQQVADSLQKNIADAVPGLINDVQASKGSVLASFKLYHNVNVVYEFLSALADAAGAFGKKEEYEPLAADANALDTARQSLSTYIEQAARRMESGNKPSTDASAQTRQGASSSAQKKVLVIDDDDAAPKKPAKKSTKSTKKKTSPSSSAPPAQSSASPH